MPKEATHTDIGVLFILENWQIEVVISIRNNVQNIYFLEFELRGFKLEEVKCMGWKLSVKTKLLS